MTGGQRLEAILKSGLEAKVNRGHDAAKHHKMCEQPKTFLLSGRIVQRMTNVFDVRWSFRSIFLDYKAMRGFAVKVLEWKGVEGIQNLASTDILCYHCAGL
jgi:hypothetical protein